MDPVFSLIVITGTLIVGYSIWVIVNSHGAKSGRRQRLRKSDRTPLNKQQKKVYKEALQQYQAGNFKSSARMLESLNMTREAISLLEHCKLIHEAAAILLRINRPNRAAHVYARHEMWKEATECFKKANMPENVAQCAQKSGDIATAVAYFLEAKKLQEAAECYEELGRHHEAARLYLELNQKEKYIEQYRFSTERNTSIEGSQYTTNEAEHITNFILEGGDETGIIEILIAKQMTTPILVYLVKEQEVDRAISIYQKSSTEAGTKLISSNEFDYEESKTLADIFAKSSAFEFAGIVYERTEQFENAGKMFALAEDYERAVHCYERAKLSEKVTEMRIELASRGPSKPKNKIDINTKKTVEDDRFKIESTLIEEMKTTSGNDFLNDEPTLNIPISVEIPSADFALSSQKPFTTNSHEEKIIENCDWSGLEDCFLLQDLTSEQLDEFKRNGTIKDYEKGEIIIDYDSEPVGIYFILSGIIGVHKVVDGEDSLIDQMAPPEAIGKLWIFIDQPSSVRFVALDKAKLFSVNRGNFNKILDKNGTIARHIYKRFTLTLIDKITAAKEVSEKLEAS